MKTASTGAPTALYERARALVAREYGRGLTLRSAAAALASSPRQVQRAYALAGEMTFAEDLRQRRLRAAAELLAGQPAIPVATVARLAGYRRGTFAPAFARRYGRTPAGFRAAALSSPVSGRTASSPGSRRRTSVPPPGAGSALIAPPSWAATWRTIARPSPDPGRLRASAPR